jgi:hypothetical protein
MEYPFTDEELKRVADDNDDEEAVLGFVLGILIERQRVYEPRPLFRKAMEVAVSYITNERDNK